jgi:hypothetical protein
VNASRLLRLCVVLLLGFGCTAGCAGTAGQEAARSSSRAVYRTPELTILKTRSQWYDPVDFRRAMSDRKQALREAGAPGRIIRQFDATLPRTRGLDLALTAETESGLARFATFGFIMDPRTRVLVQGAGALVACLRNPETGELADVPDAGLLVLQVDGYETRFADSAERPLRLDWQCQQPAADTPSTVYARFAHRYRDWEIVSVRLDSTLVQVMTDP